MLGKTEDVYQSQRLEESCEVDSSNYPWALPPGFFSRHWILLATHPTDYRQIVGTVGWYDEDDSFEARKAVFYWYRGYRPDSEPVAEPIGESTEDDLEESPVGGTDTCPPSLAPDNKTVFLDSAGACPPPVEQPGLSISKEFMPTILTLSQAEEFLRFWHI